MVREASERRVAPGTPINMLKKRIKRAAAAAAAAAAGVPAQSTAGGQHGGSFRPTVGAKATVAATGGGRTQVGGGTVYVSKGLSRAARTKHGNVGGASSHILDAARMKKVSEYLKSQISEANMLLEVRLVHYNTIAMKTDIQCRIGTAALCHCREELAPCSYP